MPIDLGSFKSKSGDFVLSYRNGIFGFEGKPPEGAVLKRKISTIFNDVRLYFRHFITGPILIYTLRNWVIKATTESHARWRFVSSIEVVQAMFTIRKWDSKAYGYLKTRFQPTKLDSGQIIQIKAVVLQCLREWKAWTIARKDDPAIFEVVDGKGGVDIRLKFDPKENRGKGAFVLVRGNLNIKLLMGHIKTSYYPHLNSQNQKAAMISASWISAHKKSNPSKVIGIYSAFVKMLYIHSKRGYWHSFADSIPAIDVYLRATFLRVKTFEEKNKVSTKIAWGARALLALANCQKYRKSVDPIQQAPALPPSGIGGLGKLRDTAFSKQQPFSDTNGASSLSSTPTPVMAPKTTNRSATEILGDILGGDETPAPFAQKKPSEPKTTAPETEEYDDLPRSASKREKAKYLSLPETEDSAHVISKTTEIPAPEPEGDYAAFDLKSPGVKNQVRGGVVPPKVPPLFPEKGPDYVGLEGLSGRHSGSYHSKRRGSIRQRKRSSLRKSSGSVSSRKSKKK